MKFYIFLNLLFLLLCKPADPNYRIKPLQNTEYTGFIARNFFQAVVEVPLTKEELPILEERKSCQLDAIKQRDQIVIPLLKKIAMENNWNGKEERVETKLKEKGSIISSKNPSINRGEFGWFLDTMFLYKEDYSHPEKCSFVFRNIQENLYEKVENTKLTYIGEDYKKKPTGLPNENPTTQPNSTNPVNMGLPQTTR